MNGSVSSIEWANHVCDHKELATKVFGGMKLFGGVDVDANVAMWNALREMFEQLDQNKTGCLTWDEFEAAVSKKKEEGLKS